MTLVAHFSAGRCPLRPNLRMAILAAALYALTAPVVATAQEAVVSTSVVSPGSITATSRINLSTVTPKSAADRGVALPSLSLIDDGSGPRVTGLLLEMPKVDLGGISIGSRLGDQRFPAVFRGGALAGSALAAPVRGLTLTTAGNAPLTVSLGQIPPTKLASSSAIAAAAVSFTPGSRVSITPQLLLPSGSPDAPTSVRTAVQAQIIGHFSMATDVGMAGTAESSWAPLASARLVGQWPRAGIETVVLRGAAAPRTVGSPALVSSRDREAAQVQVQPVPGLTLAALTSVSRPSSDTFADDTTLGSFRIAYDGFAKGQVSAIQQRQATASRSSDISSLEWRQRGAGQMTARYVRESASDSALADGNTSSSRLELDLPVLAPHSPGSLDLRAEITAGSISPTDSGVISKLSGRFALMDHATLSGETELGLAAGDGQLLRGLRVITEMPVVPAIRLQLSYAYSTGAEFPLGQVVEARLLRRVSLGW